MVPISQLGTSSTSSSSSPDNLGGRVTSAEIRSLSTERELRELRSQFEELSVLLQNLCQDFDNLIQEHLIPIQSRGERSCQQCHVVRTSTALLLGSIFPDLGRILHRGGGSASSDSGSSDSDELHSPSSSIPPLNTPSSNLDEEEYYPALRTTDVSPILEEAGSLNVSFRSVGEGGDDVWEVLTGGGVREDSV